MVPVAMGRSARIGRVMTSWRGGAALSSRSVSMMVEMMAMVVMMGRPLPSLFVQIGLQRALDDGLLQIKVGGLQF